MMGGDSGSQEDMFAKLESMRGIITEVNTQFKDPVRPPLYNNTPYSHCSTGENNLRLCLHIRVPVSLRNGASRARARYIWD